MPTNALGGIPSGWSNLTPVKWRARGYGLDTNRTIEELRAANVPLIFVANCWMVNAFDFEDWLEKKYREAGGTKPVNLEEQRRKEIIEALNRAQAELRKSNGDVAPTPPKKPKRKRSQPKPTGESR